MASDSIFESFPAYSQCFMRGEYAGLFISDLVQFCRLKWQPVDPPVPVWGPCLLGGRNPDRGNWISSLLGAGLRRCFSKCLVELLKYLVAKRKLCQVLWTGLVYSPGD